MSKKKILIIDDSALMRRVLCDIIEEDERFEVADKAINGLEALELIIHNTYDAVVLDVNMPKMTGIELLRELQKRQISVRVMMASTDTMEGAKVTLDALELGAIDFIHKPGKSMDAKEDKFKVDFMRILNAVVSSNSPVFTKQISREKQLESTHRFTELIQKHVLTTTGNKIVAIASSTGGPKALQSVVPRLPANLNAPVLIVQHMPAGFTLSLAERLNSLSDLVVKEAAEGDILKKGHVYLAKGGKHMNVAQRAGQDYIHYSDEPSREGVKPCANYMYESLMGCTYDVVVCVVLTGMGADGTKGIANLKAARKVHVIAQEQSTCAVYGMPKSIVTTGLANQVVGLNQVAEEIIMNVGVR